MNRSDNWKRNFGWKWYHDYLVRLIIALAATALLFMFLATCLS